MQNFKNHLRFYVPHHFVFYPIAIFLLVISFYLGINEKDTRIIWVGFFVVIFLVAWLSFMLRQHYSLTSQNRIIRLEMRFRYYVLTQKRLEEYESKLSFGQIAALRFASDRELPELMNQALTENLTPAQIKKRVRDWQADFMRV